MMRRARLGFCFTVLMLVLSTAVVALADPPTRVARLQYTSGQISVQPGGVNDWVEASINRPLTSADRVWADKESRAELHLGGALMRINSETSMTLTNVSDATVQVELDQGTLNVHVRHLYNQEIYEIDTPNLAFTITKAGEYRFDVDPNKDTTSVTVWKGRGEATGEGRAVRVDRGEQAKFSGGTSLEHRMVGEPDRDGFDDWCVVRDRRLAESQSARYVSPDVIGAEDLDQYGTWRAVPAYGPVWMPAVAPGWAPYHYGHWMWVDPWGWTWVDDAPWGFAPCHYGRWVYYGGTWGWAPGPVAVRPVYAPALVAWVGGSHWGIAITSGEPVGWFPLGYGEPYIPPYGASRGYFQQVNVSNTRITNITNVTNNYYNTTNVTNVTNVTNTTNVTNVSNIHYANVSVPGAVTAVPKSALVSAQPVARACVKIPTAELRQVSVAVTPPVVPQKESVLGQHAGGPAALPPSRLMQSARPVVSRVAPPARPLPFEAKQQALAAHPGRPLDHDDEQRIRTQIARQPVNARPGTEGQSAAPQHENQNAERGQVPQRNAGGPQPGQAASNIHANGRAVMPPAETTTQNSRGPVGAELPRSAPDRYVPRPPQRDEQLGPAETKETSKSAPAHPVARPIETREAEAGSARSAEPVEGQRGEGGVVEQSTGTRPVPRPPQAGRTEEGQGNGRTAYQSQRPAAAPTTSEQRRVPQPPERSNVRPNAPAREPGPATQRDDLKLARHNSNYPAAYPSRSELPPQPVPRQETPAASKEGRPAAANHKPKPQAVHSTEHGKAVENRN